MTNEEFLSLPKNEQRILIAQDVISQLKAEKYRTERYTFGWATAHDLKIKNKDNLQTVLLEQNPVCTVCADGGIYFN